MKRNVGGEGNSEKPLWYALFDSRYRASMHRSLLRHSSNAGPENDRMTPVN